MTEREITLGSSWLGAATIIVGAVNYGYSVLLMRLLNISMYPIFATGQALLLTVATTATAGIPWVLAREISVEREETRRRQAISFALAVGSCQAFITAAVVVVLVSHFRSLSVVLSMVAASLVINEASIAVGYLQGQRRIKPIAVLRLVEVLVKVVSGLVLYYLGAGVAGILIGFCLGSAAPLVYGLRSMRGSIAISAESMLIRRLWRDAAGMLGIQASAAIYFGLDVVVAGLIMPMDDQLASYLAALAISRVPMYLSVAGATVVFQGLTAASCHVARTIRSSICLYLAVALPLVFVISSVPQEIISFGLSDNYHYMRELLGATAIVGGAFGLINLCKTYLQAAQSFAGCTILLLGMSVVQTVALMVGYRLNGVFGLAWADVFGGAMLVICLLVVLRRRWPDSTRRLCRVVFILTLLGAPLIALSQHPWLWLMYAALVGVVITRFMVMRMRLQPEPEPTRTGELDGAGRGTVW